jgi:hypothetical protein
MKTALLFLFLFVVCADSYYVEQVEDHVLVQESDLIIEGKVTEFVYSRSETQRLQTKYKIHIQDILKGDTIPSKMFVKIF